MARLLNDFADLGARSPVTFAVVGLYARQRLRHAWVSACRTFCNWLSWLAFVLVVATGSGALAQTQQMNTVETGVGSPSGVTSDAQGNIYFPYFGYIYYVQAGTTGLSAVNVSGAGGLYPFSQSIVALNSDVSGDLFVAVQNPLNSPTNGPYVQVYELLQGSSGYTWGGLVASPSGSTPPPLNGGTYSTLNSMAYDNLNGFLYLNYFTGPEGQQVITCINAVSPFTGYTTSGSTTVTVSSTSGLFPGQVINSAGPQIPAGDTIASVGAGTITEIL